MLDEGEGGEGGPGGEKSKASNNKKQNIHDILCDDIISLEERVEKTEQTREKRNDNFMKRIHKAIDGNDVVGCSHRTMI